MKKKDKPKKRKIITSINQESRDMTYEGTSDNNKERIRLKREHTSKEQYRVEGFEIPSARLKSTRLPEDPRSRKEPSRASCLIR